MINNVKNLYVVFKPFCGGMHLVHMLTMCPEFRAHPQEDDYINKIIQLYASKNPTNSIGMPTAHVLPHRHIADIYELTNKEEILSSTHVNIFHGHLQSYQTALMNGVLDDLGPFTAVMIGTPKDPDSLAFRRLDKILRELPETIGNPDKYEIPFEYTYDEKTLRLDESNTLKLDCDLYCSEGGSNYVRTFFCDNFGVTLPKQADILHAIWIRKIRNNLS